MANGISSARPGRRGVLIFAAFLLAAGLVGCKPQVRTADNDPVPGATPETANKAARDFFAAVAKKDTAKALSMVLAAERDKAKAAFEKPPSLPVDMELKVRVRGRQARATCTNPGYEGLGLKMLFVDNQWWVTLSD